MDLVRDFEQIVDFELVQDFEVASGFPDLVGNWQQDFQDPPSTGGESAESDPFFASVVALLHFNGAQDSTTITDVRGHDFAATVQDTGPKLDTTIKKFGASSVYMGNNTVNTGYITCTASADFGFGTGDFTVDIWVYQTDQGAVGKIIQVNNGTSVRWTMDWSGTALVVNNGSSDLITANAAYTANAWHLLTYSRVGTTGYLFVDGVLKGSATDATNYASGSLSFSLRSDAPPFNHFRGYFDEARVTKGVGRHTENFPAPDFPFAEAA
jgi:hypothetical protein